MGARQPARLVELLVYPKKIQIIISYSEFVYLYVPIVYGLLLLRVVIIRNNKGPDLSDLTDILVQRLREDSSLLHCPSILDDRRFRADYGGCRRPAP
jgi:hypothetical protein